MTAAQAVFALALAVVVLVVVAFGGGRGAAPPCAPAAAPTRRRLAGRLLRVPEERAEANRWAFYAHRITGVAILAFLCLHVLDVGVWTLSRPVFDEVHELYGDGAAAGVRVRPAGGASSSTRSTACGSSPIDAADLGAARRGPAAGRGGRPHRAARAAAGSAVILAPLVA